MKKNWIVLGIVPLVLVFLPLAKAQAAQTTLSTNSDSDVSQNLPDDNWGNESNLYVVHHHYPTYTDRIYTFINFDLSGIPANSTVNSASLQGKLAYRDTSPGNTFRVNLAGSAWQETTITWNNKPAPNGYLTFTIPCNQGQTASLNITTLIQAAVNGSPAWHGLSISNDDASFFIYGFYSREYNGGSDPMKLVVDYTAPSSGNSSNNSSQSSSGSNSSNSNGQTGSSSSSSSAAKTKSPTKSATVTASATATSSASALAQGAAGEKTPWYFSTWFQWLTLLLGLALVVLLIVLISRRHANKIKPEQKPLAPDTKTEIKKPDNKPAEKTPDNKPQDKKPS